ncbi:hypothetical protein KA005_05695, partial [bacterium]|nr:hypothetical protein [bacterium]
KDIQKVTIPSTIQDVIMARVDSLPEGAKEVLQTGSVIEREFNYELIKRVMIISQGELLSHLSVLKDSELLYERGIFPQSTYIFNHALTREVVYDGILIQRKKKLHEEIGYAIEELYKDNIDEQYSVLFEHYISAENYEKGAEYSKLASKKAEKAASFPDAIAYAGKRIDCLEKLPLTADVQKRIIDARTVLGLYYMQINYHIEAKEAVEPIIDLAIKQGYKRRLSQIYIIIGSYNFAIEGYFPQAFRHLEESIKISEEINDFVSLVLANYFLGIALSLNCEFEKAVEYLKKALNINVVANNLWGIAAIKSAISYFVYYHQGRINLAYQNSDESIQITEENDDIFSKAISYTCYGVSCYGKGLLDEATKHLLMSIDLCEKINFYLWNSIAHCYLGKIYFENGDYEKSNDYYDKTIWLIENNKLLSSWLNFNKIALARAKVANNEKDINLKSLYDYVYDNKANIYEGWMARYIAEILLNVDDQHMPEAADWIKKAIEADTRNDMRFNLGRDYALYAELFKRKGDQSKAKENLGKAIEILRECGADGWVVKYEKELALLL